MDEDVRDDIFSCDSNLVRTFVIVEVELNNVFPFNVRCKVGCQGCFIG